MKRALSILKDFVVPYWKIVLLIMKADRKLFLLQVFFAVLHATLPLLGFYILKLIIDKLMFFLSLKSINISESFILLVSLLLIWGLVRISITILSVIEEWVNQSQTHRITDHITGLIHQKSQEVSFHFFDEATFHQRLHRAQTESDWRPVAIWNSLVLLLQNLFGLLIIGGILFTIHWAFPLVLIAVVLPGFFIRVRESDKLYEWRKAKNELELKSSYFHHWLTDIAFAKEIRVFIAGNFLISKYKSFRQQLLQEYNKINKRKTTFLLVATIGELTTLILLFGFLIFQTLKKLFTLGDFVFYVQTIQQGFGSLQGIVGNISYIYENRLFLTDLLEFLALPSPQTLLPSRIPLNEPITIKVENVWFRYPNSPNWTIKNINMTFRKGEIIALIGRNGSGKTTFSKLLSGLYLPTKGTIYWDDVDTSTIEQSQLWKHQGILFQDYGKYYLSIKENIIFGKDESQFQEKELIEILERSQLLKKVNSFPEGLDTQLGKIFENGEELSGGEWQRLSLARAMIKQSSLIILDEPTDSLDPEMESIIFSSLRTWFPESMVIIITHRVAHLNNFDSLYLFENGEIIASGSPSLLQQHSKPYREFCSFQKKN